MDERWSRVQTYRARDLIGTAVSVESRELQNIHKALLVP